MVANDKYTTQFCFVDGRKLGLVSGVTGYIELMRVVCPQCHRQLPYLLHCPVCVYMVCSLPLCLLFLLCFSISLSTPLSFVLFSCFLSHLCFLNLSYYLRSYLSMCVSDSVVRLPIVVAQVLGSSGSVERRLRGTLRMTLAFLGCISKNWTLSFHLELLLFFSNLHFSKLISISSK